MKVRLQSSNEAVINRGELYSAAKRSKPLPNALGIKSSVNRVKVRRFRMDAKDKFVLPLRKFRVSRSLEYQGLSESGHPLWV